MEKITTNLGITERTKSLCEIIGVCSDFINEEGMLQHVGRKLGVNVMLTPKCHAEMAAGEGIDYIWACSKEYNGNLTLSHKRGKERFNDGVRASHCQQKF